MLDNTFLKTSFIIFILYVLYLYIWKVKFKIKTLSFLRVSIKIIILFFKNLFKGRDLTLKLSEYKKALNFLQVWAFL